ncbi:hypothetical protein B0H15DRAFT_829272 [Mycena belliarum]|uniref:Uncharacterized protein n=1 Tax=Mycena belliarum TaxID=1033014 RepID=A0AAD6U900_9AGAR|nr:hypothetical protein B0H15DRAFT_829272 [Mycena belliae]
MATPAPFSRLQLAAALLEYDNDPTNPEAPHRSAHESAIFANFRRAQSRAQLAARRSDYLGVALPSETGSLGGRESALSGRRSRGSLNILRNPFGADDHGEYDEDEDDEGEDKNELEVDLSSWGLDAFMPKDSKGAKRISRTATFPNPHPLQPVPSYRGEAAPRRTTRSMSVGNMDQLTGGVEENRRKSFASPLDLEQMGPSSFQRNRAASHSFVQTLPATSPPPHHSVPFPTGSARSPSPQSGPDDFRSSTFTSRFDPKALPLERRQSYASQDPRSVFHGDNDENVGPRLRATSNGSMNSRVLLADDNPFALRPPSTMSKFDPKAAAHARTMSNASLGSRMMLDDVSVMTGQGRERRYSTLELLRPKILVMPSPLQPTSGAIPAASAHAREGFLSSADPPLPPGARSARRSSSANLSVDPFSAPAASNLFTPNPRMNLSLSQLTFRNTLLVGGQRDVTYADIDKDLPRAVQDGDQVQQTTAETEAEAIAQILTPSEDQLKPNRPAGKLFGKSLIDDLESRKAMMRTKQRVFTGDDRPSMMARPQAQRQSTLIDPALLQVRPVSQGRPLTQHMSSFDPQGSQQALDRRNSVNAKPLLNFDDDKLLRPGASAGRVPNSRSVFGVDTLWERELVKLKEMEAKEKIEEDLQRAKEAEAEARESKKRGRKARRKDKSDAQDYLPQPDATNVDTRIASSPPVLPAISPALKRPPPVNDDSDSEESERAGPLRPQDGAPEGWLSSDDDEDGGPTRTTGTGPRFVKKSRGSVPHAAADDSDEDLPLAATLDRVAQRATQLRPSAEDSDEEQPLSVLLQKTKLSLPSINFDRRSLPNGAEDEEAEDDQPLGLRASRVLPSSSSVRGDGDDDDVPLAYHPDQQRRSQYHMMAQAAQQQQQQQMMMQAQMHNSMFFSPQPMMTPPFFGPPTMMQQPPMAPMHDEAKYGRVDRWRRDVAVEEA